MYKSNKFILVVVFLKIFILSDLLNAQETENPQFTEAKKLYENGDYKKAIEGMNKIIGEDCKQSEYFLTRSQCYRKLKKYQEAYEDISKAIKFSGMEAKYYYERGLLFQEVGRITNAIDDFTMAKNYSDDDSLTFNSVLRRGHLRSQVRDFQNAIPDYEYLYKIRPNDRIVLNDYAMLLNELERRDSAIMLLNKIIENDSLDFVGYQNIAFVYMGMEKYDEALKNIEKSLKLMKEPNAYIFNNRGYIKFKLKDIEGALKDINLSLKLDKTNSYAYRNRALVYLDQGKTDKACEDLEKALELNYTRQHGDDVMELYNSNCK